MKGVPMDDAMTVQDTDVEMVGIMVLNAMLFLY